MPEGSSPPQTRGRRISVSPRQPLAAGVYAGLAFASLAATILVAYGMYYAGTQLVAQPTMRSFYYVLLWVLGITSSLFLFGVLRSAATISGQQWGAMVDVGGPAALAVLVVIGGYKFAELPETFSLTIRLQGDDSIAEMAMGAKIWVDLNGRREHKGFDGDGEVIIQEVPAHFATDPVPITFESNEFRIAGASNSESLLIPADHVIDLKLIRMPPSEQRLRQLNERYSNILDEVSLELSSRGSVLFPTIERYLDSPSRPAWSAVKEAATKSAAEIRTARDIEVDMNHKNDWSNLPARATIFLWSLPPSPKP